MKRLSTFFKKLVDWYRDSNRHIHAKLGAIIFIIMTLLCITMSVSLPHVLVISTITTLLVMIAVEIAQKRDGGLFDWSDILAGMSGAICSWFLYFVYIIYLLLIL